MQKLKLNQLKLNRPGMTKSIGAFLAEAATVCLVQNQHSSGVVMQVLGATNTIPVIIEWTDKIDLTTLISWRDTKEATEYGAMGISVLLMEKLYGYYVVGRLKQGEFSDYLLANTTSRSNPFAKMEVTGIAKESNTNTLSIRINLKKKQVAKSKTKPFPVYIFVIEFSVPKAKNIIV